MLGLAARALEWTFLAMCDMGIYIYYIYIWDDAVRLPTICDDLMDFGHDTNQFYSIT